MPKKKEQPQEKAKVDDSNQDMSQLESKLEEHAVAIDALKQQLNSMVSALTQLKERNRLR